MDTVMNTVRISKSFSQNYLSQHRPHYDSLGADCSHCGPKVVTAEDVKDVEVPEWKKKALQQHTTSETAPFGLSWSAESSTTASDARQKHTAESETHHNHRHEHHEHHSHGEH